MIGGAARQDLIYVKLMPAECYNSTGKCAWLLDGRRLSWLVVRAGICGPVLIAASMTLAGVAIRPYLARNLGARDYSAGAW